MRVAKFIRPLSVSFTEDLFLKIKDITDREEISMAEWVRRVSEEAVRNENLKSK